MTGGHCLKVWTKKQQVVSLSTAESELYAAVKTASEGLGIQRGNGLGDSMWAEPTSGCLSDDVPGQSQRIGKANHVDVQNLWIQEVVSQSGRSRRRSARA